MFDIWLMLLFGVVGYVFKKIGIPLAPFTLALVLGNRRRFLSPVDDRLGGDMRVFCRTAWSARSHARARPALLAADRRRVRPDAGAFRQEDKPRGKKLMSGEILLERDGDIATVTLSNRASSTRSDSVRGSGWGRSCASSMPTSACAAS